MGVYRVILPCKVCNEVGVSHRISAEDIDLETMELRSSWLRRACFGCREVMSRDGKGRHGFNMLSTIESFEGEIRDKIRREQVRVYGSVEVRAYEERLKMRGELCEIGRYSYREGDPVCDVCRERGFLCPFIGIEESEVMVRREVHEGVKSLVCSLLLEEYGNQKQYLRQRKKWFKALTLPALGLWGKHRNRHRLVSVVVYHGVDQKVGDTSPLVVALEKIGVLGSFDEIEKQELFDSTVDNQLVVITVKETGDE